MILREVGMILALRARVRGVIVATPFLATLFHIPESAEAHEPLPLPTHPLSKRRPVHITLETLYGFSYIRVPVWVAYVVRHP